MKTWTAKNSVRDMISRKLFSSKSEAPFVLRLRDIVFRHKYRKNRSKKLTPLGQLQFSVHLVDHCNLNCIGCDHFAPLAKPWYADLEQTEADLKLLRDIFQGSCRYIHLMGGEPLLHPQLCRSIQLYRRYFPQATLTIVTNGTLLLKMPPEFYRTCIQERVEISISRYPISVDHDHILKTLQDKGICAYFNGPASKTMYMNPLSTSPDQDAVDSFILCHRSNNCITLRDSKLYTCTLIPVIPLLNDAFGTTYEITPNDYIDLRDRPSAQEVLARLARPADFCRYCKIRSCRYGIPWQTSKKDPQEWIDTDP